MKILKHKGKHIVVADLDAEIASLPEGDIMVWSRIGVDPSFEGLKRRGRSPLYNRKINSSELEIIDSSEISAELLRKAGLEELAQSLKS